MSAEVATLPTTRADGYRDYPQDLKAAVIQSLENNGCNALATARLFNLPRQTVDYWWSKRERFAQIQHASSVNLADKLESVAHQTVDAMAEEDLSKVSYADKARALGVVIDKMQLLRGQPTSITENVDRIELVATLQAALNGGEVIDVTPEPDPQP